MKKQIIWLLALPVVIIMTSGVAWAQIPPGIPITLSEISNFISLIANFLIGASIVIAVIFIVWAGITYMTAGGDSAKVQIAQDKIKSAVIGSLIVLAVGVILQTAAAIVNRSFFS